MPRTYRYVTLDVFTDRVFGGNPLAVFPDARGLSDGEMQAIAREFNYSESTFVLPPADPRNDARVRIFTTVAELPFAGHPNVGTATHLASAGAVLGRKIEGDTLRFEEGAGLVVMRIARDGGRAVGASLTAPEAFSRGASLPAAQVAAALSLPASAVVTTRHEPSFASVGLPFLMVEVADRAALAAAQVDSAAFAALAALQGSAALRLPLHVYTRTGDDTGPGGSVDVRARMFAPLGGTPEDPATGSANAALMGLLATLEPASDCELRLRIAQGVEMGRPSRLDGLAVKRVGRVERVELGGRSVHVMAGEITLP